MPRSVQYSVVGQMRSLALFFLLLVNNGTVQFVHGISRNLNSGMLEGSEGSPSVGAGYSGTTNAFYSTCLDFNDGSIVSPPSYNLEYYYTDFVNTGNTDLQSLLLGKISKTFAYTTVKTAVVDNDKHNQSPRARVPRYNSVATMRSDRFASFLKQTLISLPAIELLQNQNYIGYFTACGASYVRSIRRAQEVTALFTFSTDNQSTARAFSKDLGKIISGSGASLDSETMVETIYNNTRYTEVLDTLEIEVFSYGMSYTVTIGGNSPVATSLRDFNDAMDNAYTAMTQTAVTEDATIIGQDDGLVGMIDSVEVVPWVDETEFLKFAGLVGNNILVPKPRGLIPDSQEDESGVVTCSRSSLEPDDFGKCCETGEMKTVDSQKKCDPQRTLSDSVMRTNLQTNAEFVAMLDAIVRKKVQSISTLSQCVIGLRSFPEQNEYYYVRSADNAKFDASLETSFTVKELKVALDVRGDLEIVPLVSKEVDEYMEMFYEPCLEALYGMNVGTNDETDPRFFVAEPWYNHKECTRRSCLESNMVWDRKGGNGCVRGLIGRQDATAPIPDELDEFCAKQWNETTGLDYCKYTPDPEYVHQMDMCRGNLPQGKDGRGRVVPFSIAKLMDYFCMPNLNVEIGQAKAQKKDEADQAEALCSQVSIPSYPPVRITDSPTYIPTTLPLPTRPTPPTPPKTPSPTKLITPNPTKLSTSHPTSAGFCNTQELIGKELKFVRREYEEYCYKVKLGDGGTVTLDTHNMGCANPTFAEVDVISKFSHMEGNKFIYRYNQNGQITGFLDGYVLVKTDSSLQNDQVDETVRNNQFAVEFTYITCP